MCGNTADNPSPETAYEIGPDFMKPVVIIVFSSSLFSFRTSPRLPHLCVIGLRPGRPPEIERWIDVLCYRSLLHYLHETNLFGYLWPRIYND